MNYKSSKKVILASGKVFADALAGGQLSIALDAPILLTPSNKLDASVKKEVSRLSAKEVIILGGSGSVSNDIEKELGIKNISRDRKSTRLNSSHANISYAVFCLKHNTRSYVGC